MCQTYVRRLTKRTNLVMSAPKKNIAKGDDAQLTVTPESKPLVARYFPSGLKHKFSQLLLCSSTLSRELNNANPGCNMKTTSKNENKNACVWPVVEIREETYQIKAPVLVS